MAFELRNHELRNNEFGEIILQPLTRSGADVIGAALAEMEPWSTIGMSAERLVRSLKQKRPCVRRYQVLVGDDIGGIISIHDPWLYGPYLQLLAVLPAYQGKTLGLDLLKWLEGEARAQDARQMWLCVSTINSRARTFYERWGFEEVAVLKKLSTDNIDEVLMQKRLRYSQPA